MKGSWALTTTISGHTHHRNSQCRRLSLYIFFVLICNIFPCKSKFIFSVHPGTDCTVNLELEHLSVRCEKTIFCCGCFFLLFDLADNVWSRFAAVMCNMLKVKWLYLFQENELQSFKLPCSVLCIGGVVKVELLGRVQKQRDDDLYYIGWVPRPFSLGDEMWPCTSGLSGFS